MYISLSACDMGKTNPVRTYDEIFTHGFNLILAGFEIKHLLL